MEGKGQRVALASIKTRIKKAQANAHAGEDLGRIAELLNRGAFYDELTDEEKNIYCAYYGADRQALEEVTSVVMGSLHFKLEHKPKPPTETQFRERVQEVEAFMQEPTI